MGAERRIAPVARILIVAGGCRGLLLAERLTSDGSAVRVTTRDRTKRGTIEAAGAECWVGTPDRLATMRGVLDGVAVVIWALGAARGDDTELASLHADRLRAFLTQAIDSTVRGVVYEASGRPQGPIAAGAQIARDLCGANSIPLLLLEVDPEDAEAWADGARGAIDTLLAAG